MSDLVHYLPTYVAKETAPVHSVPFYVGQDVIACLVTLQPYAVVPVHSHEHHVEIFDVVEGEGTFELAGEAHLLKPGMTICVPAGTMHSLTAGEKPWVLRETVHQHIYARQAIWRAVRKRLNKLWSGAVR